MVQDRFAQVVARTLALADMRDPIDNRPYLAEFFSAKDLTNSKISANLVV